MTPQAARTFERGILGRTGLDVCRLGLASSYGPPAAAVERAFEQGVNYLFWGSRRRDGFGQAIRNLKSQRERMVLVIESYSRVAGLLGWSLERALRSLGLEYADVLLLGLWNKKPPARILEQGIKARERGLVRHLAISTHRRPLVAELAADREIGVFHLRYNAVHPGAERDVFPLLSGADKPGIVAFTATSWRQLLNPKSVPPGDKVPTATDCYRFVLSQPAVDVCISGPASAAHVDEALAALRGGPLSPEETAWMRRVGEAIYRRPALRR